MDLHQPCSLTPQYPPVTPKLSSWIKETTPGKELKYIDTPHAQGYHYLGNPVMRKQFPGAISWEGWFPNGLILVESRVIHQSLPAHGELSIDNSSLFGIDVVHFDTNASSFRHAPYLNIVIAGDIFYGNCFQFLAEAKTAEKRKNWLGTLDQIAVLGPAIVVPGHKRASQVDGPYLIESNFASEEETNRLRDLEQIEEAMTKRSHRGGIGMSWTAAKAV
ncbi:hypothetical protein PENCOP_c001G07176 [Penicillium coprophilum]|uniref:Metallo-beta-lactamase domain-containing protein n=1 Tax=Penicillium coprophilum TaxID=36646 RepID=A0A1V6V7Z8_9EURO|nr:hypothetical protein PENCOP_c001G07176 [Penicillium coprophilum]